MTDSATKFPQALYEAVKRTDMYDEALKMYTISGSLKGMSMDIGRMMAFVPGWLENQSVWLHMSYKCVRTRWPGMM